MIDYIQPFKRHWLCRLFGHRLRHINFVGSCHFKFAPEFEWVRKVTKEPWYGKVCSRCNCGAPGLRIYADDGTLVWAAHMEDKA